MSARPTSAPTIAQAIGTMLSRRAAGGMARPTSRKTTAVSRYARNSQTVSMASAPVLGQDPARAHVAEHDGRGHRGEDAGEVQLVGEQVAAVREDDRDGELDQVVVDRGS